MLIGGGRLCVEELIAELIEAPQLFKALDHEGLDLWGPAAGVARDVDRARLVARLRVKASLPERGGERLAVPVREVGERGRTGTDLLPERGEPRDDLRLRGREADDVVAPPVIVEAAVFFFVDEGRGGEPPGLSPLA